MILDIIIIVLVLGGAFLGYKKGLVGILVSFVSIILALILGFCLQGPVSKMLYDTGIGSSLEQTIYEGMNKEKTETSEQNKEKNMYNTIVEGITNKAQETLTSEQSAKAVTMYILKGISFVGIVLIVFIICYILSMVLNIVFDLPILSSLNKYGGLAAGFLKSIIKIYIVLAIISFLAPIPVIEPVIKFIEASNITRILYQNNLLVYLINITIKV